jgi:hypothetical protein
MKSASTTNALGVYGTLGTAAAGNTPGARVDSVSWVDNNGNLWLFGGSVHVESGGSTSRNDLWRFGP